jgi:methionyl-tRNA formyltransferase
MTGQDDARNDAAMPDGVAKADAARPVTEPAAPRAPLRVVFMGTPGFAAVILRHLLEWDGCEVIAAYTQPDRPCGRGQQCRPPEVKLLAIEHGVPVYQPLNFKTEKAVAELRALRPDVLVVAAYGLILPQSVLDIPRLGPVNVHASLLPRLRGAAPIQRAVMAGDAVTGVTIMRMEASLDTGPMLLQKAMGIGIGDTAGDLHDQLADLGGRLLTVALGKLADGTAVAIPQDNERATYAAKLTKADGLIDWNRTAVQVHAHIRGVTPWPGAYCTIQREGQKELRVALGPGRIGPLRSEAPEYEGATPGTIVGLVDDQLAIACTDRLYLVDSIRPADRKPMDARAFLCGYLNACECDGGLAVCV